MKLVPNWRELLNEAWSIRLNLLGAVLGGVEIALPVFVDAFPRKTFLVLSISVCLLAMAARLLYQRKLHDGR